MDKPAHGITFTQAPAPAPEPAQSLGFARYLALVSLVLVLILSAVLTTYIGNEARKSLLSKRREFASLLAENLNHQIYRRFSLPTMIGFGRIALRNPAQYEQLDMVVQSTIHGLHVERLRIFAHDHTVTYSTVADEPGKTDLFTPSVDAATTTDEPIFDIDAAIPYWRAFFQFDLEPGTFSLRTTYPMRMPNRLISSNEEGPIMGVLEFTQDITGDMVSAIRFQQLIIVVTLSSSGMLLTLLLLFIRRAERAIAARMVKEQGLLMELHQNEKLAGMGRVVASIAHEIRNPLGIIRSSAELLLKRAATTADERTSRILQAIYDESMRLSQTVSDFLDYARPRPPRHDSVDIVAVIDQALAFLEPELNSRDIGVARSGALDAPLIVKGDKDLLYRALYNLISNGMQAVGNAGTLSISLGRHAGPPAIVEICVQDSGPGFPEDNMAQLLDPFFTTKDGGTGLGLPIVSNILAGHGGSLSLSNAPEGGAVARITLPAA